jgi:protein-L-isoaspartate(D-aspartate) O-methyltransferase
MMEKLDILPGAHILEVGAGCGYAAAIAAILCSPGGSLVAAEIVPELALIARENCAVALASANLAGIAPVSVLAMDGSTGLPDYPRFDRILLSAGVSRGRFQEEILLNRLTETGILIYPEAHGRIFRVRKRETKRGTELQRESWGGVSFVRLRGRNS